MKSKSPLNSDEPSPKSPKDITSANSVTVKPETATPKAAHSSSTPFVVEASCRRAKCKRLIKRNWLVVLGGITFTIYYVWTMDHARFLGLLDNIVADLIFGVVVFGVLFLSRGRLEKPFICLIEYFEPIVNQALEHDDEG